MSVIDREPSLPRTFEALRRLHRAERRQRAGLGTNHTPFREGRVGRNVCICPDVGHVGEEAGGFL